MLPLVLAIENCETILEPQDIPCRVISTWNYTGTCTNYQANFYNNSGDNIINYTFTDYGTTGLCTFNFNVSTIGSYTFIVDNGDTGEIIIRYVNMQLGITIGIGIVIAIFMFLAFKLDNSHSLLRLLLIFFSVALISIIPAVYVIDSFATVFYKVIMGFVVVFWLYVGGYFFYWLYQKLMKIVTYRK